MAERHGVYVAPFDLNAAAPTPPQGMWDTTPCAVCLVPWWQHANIGPEWIERSNQARELLYGMVDVIEPELSNDELRAENARLTREIARLNDCLDASVSPAEMLTRIKDGLYDVRTTYHGVEFGDDEGVESTPFIKHLLVILMGILETDGEFPPPNYRTGHAALKPAGGFDEYRLSWEVVKPGGHTSHEIREALAVALVSAAGWIERHMVLDGAEEVHDAVMKALTIHRPPVIP